MSINLNGNIEVSITLNDRVFLGEGLFETLRFENKKPVSARAHFERLSRSAAYLHLSFQLNYEQWCRQLDDAINKSSFNQGGIKVILMGGAAERGLIQTSSTPHLYCYAFEYKVNTKPLKLMTTPWRRDNNNCLYRVKSVNYLEAILARREAIAKGFDDAIFFNTDNHLLEATSANIFVILNSQVLTPKAQDAILPGIVRQQLIQYAANSDYPIIETDITHDMMLSAEAVFLTNSLQKIQPVLSWDSKSYTLCHPAVAYFSSYIDHSR